MMATHLLVLVLFVALMLSAVAGPRVLRSAAPTLMRFPRLAIALLTGGVVAWALAALSIGPLLAWVVSGPAILPGSAAEVCSQCLAAADPFGLDRVDIGIPVALLVVIPVAVSLAYAISMVRDLRRRRRRVVDTARRVRSIGTAHRLQGHSVVLVDDPHPYALALPRRHGGIVVSRGAVAALETDELRAVLAHESAHLRQRHHLITAVVTTLTSRLNRIPLFAAAETALGHYLEIAADDAARREIGTSALASALLVLGESQRAAAPGEYGAVGGAEPGARDQPELTEGPPLDGALYATGPDRIRHLVDPSAGPSGMVAATASAFCLTALATLAAVVHVPYALAALTGCF